VWHRCVNNHSQDTTFIIVPTYFFTCNMAVASVWGSVKQAETSLDDVMSEQLAVDLQIKENMLASPQANPVSIEAVEICEGQEPEEDVSSDWLLAQHLQEEEIRGHDDDLLQQQKQVNGGSKVCISYEKYLHGNNSYKVCQSESEEEEYDDDTDRTCDWDTFDSRKHDEPSIPQCGYTMHNDKLVTKHDRHIAGRKNACKVMDLPPSIKTGDGGGFDMEIPNKVLNSLKRHAQAESKKKHRIADKEDRATSAALDNNTRLLIHKMINKGLLEGAHGVISTGKEATIFHAFGGPSEEVEVPEHCVLKVFKTMQNEFKTREKYIKADIRFKDKASRHNQRALIHVWAEKEMCNLKRLTRANIRCPTPIELREHVLVMSLIGEGGQPAPKLKNVTLSPRQWRDAYSQVVQMTRSMYTDSNLIHADLSEYNILYHAGLCWLIDVSQAVEPFHPDALQFLYRDCSNITSFFASKGVEVPSTAGMFGEVTGLELAEGEDAEPVESQLTRLAETQQPRRRGQRRTDEAELQLRLDEQGHFN